MHSGSYRRFLHAKQQANRRRFWSTLFPAMALLDELEPRTLLAGLPTQVQFQVQPPLNWAANAVISPSNPVKIVVLDANGAQVNDSTGTITLSLLGPGGPVSAKLTNSTGNNPTFTANVSVKANNGNGVFPNLMVDTPGTYYLQAQYTTVGNILILATSNFFAIGSPATQVVYASPPPTTITAGDVFSLTLNVEDASGATVSTDLSTGTLTIATGPNGAAISGTTVVQTNTNGQLIFSGLQLKKSGNYTLKVTAGNSTSIVKTLTAATSPTITVSPGAPAALKFEQTPPNTPSGLAMTPPVAVDVVDANGNIVTTNSSNVTIALSGTNGTLTGTTTRVAVNGVAKFDDLSVAELGSGYRFVATDGSLTAAVSNTFAITGPATKLVFQSDVPQTTLGTAITPSIVVLVEDDGGNVVSNDSTQVTLGVASGPGSLGGTLTATAVHGVATFPGISLSQMGTYTLSASGGTLNLGTSNSFLINGLATKLAFTQGPNGSAAGAALPTVKVTVEDSAGNLVIDSSAIIKITINTGPVNASLSGTTAVTAVNGVATFSNLILSAQGTYTLNAAGTTTPLTGATSSALIVTPGASSLVFFTGPSNVALKSAIYPSVVVHILDLNGNIVTTNSTTVTLTILKGPGTMGGTTSISAINGVATFNNLSFGVRGTYQIVAHDGALTSATSTNFQVTNQALHLAFKTQPAAQVTAGAPIPDFSVRVNDKDGFLVNSDHSTVTIKITSGPTGATIIGSATAVTDHGVATFHGVSINVAGTYTFSVTDGTFTAATSSKFTIVPDLASPIIAYSVAPVTTQVGKTLPKFVAAIEDQFGNVIKTVNNGTISLSVEAGAHGTMSGKTTVSVINGLATFTNLSFNVAEIYALKATANVKVNGIAFAGSTSFAETISPVVTSLLIPSHANAYKAGQVFKLTGNVKSLVPSNNIKFSGVVNLVDLGTNTILANGTISANGSFTVSSTSNALHSIAIGNYTVAMVYDSLSDPNHTGASSPSFNLKIGATTTKLTTSKTHVSTSGTFTLTAAISTAAGLNVVAGANVPISGSVTFYDGDTTHVVATTSVITNGKATITIPDVAHTIPSAGTGAHNYFAVFLGDATTQNYYTSTSSIVVVNVS